MRLAAASLLLALLNVVTPCSVLGIGAHSHDEDRSTTRWQTRCASPSPPPATSPPPTRPPHHDDDRSLTIETQSHAGVLLVTHLPWVTSHNAGDEELATCPPLDTLDTPQDESPPDDLALEAAPTQDSTCSSGGIPNATEAITDANFKTMVLDSNQAWVIQVYADDSPDSQGFASTWEALDKLAAVGNTTVTAQPWFRMGRIDWHHQRPLVDQLAKSSCSLVEWLSNYPKSPIDWRHLPALFMVPSNCNNPKCFIRYRGRMDLGALGDSIATSLLRWRPLPLLMDVQHMDTFLQDTFPQLPRGPHPAKVVALAMLHTAEQDSLLLRYLAAHHRYRVVMSFARAVVRPGAGSDGGAWSERLGVKVEAPCLILFRGPETAPEVVMWSSGDTGDVVALLTTIRDKALEGQEVQPLRSNTIDALGCSWGGASVNHTTSATSNVTLCVVAMSHDRHALDRARAHLLGVKRSLISHTPIGDVQGEHPPHTSAASLAYASGQLRLTWLDAKAQRAFCIQHLSGDALEGSSADGDARGGQIGRRYSVKAVCGRSWRNWTRDAWDGMIALVRRGDVGGAWRQLQKPMPRAAIVAYRPSARSHVLPQHDYAIMIDGLIGFWPMDLAEWIEAYVPGDQVTPSAQPLHVWPHEDLPPPLVDETLHWFRTLLEFFFGSNHPVQLRRALVCTGIVLLVVYFTVIQKAMLRLLPPISNLHLIGGSLFIIAGMGFSVLRHSRVDPDVVVYV